MRRQDDGSNGGTEKGEVRVGAARWEVKAGRSGRLGWRHRWFLFLLLLLCCALLDVLGRDLAPKTTELSSFLASKDGAATQQHVTHHTAFSRIRM